MNEIVLNELETTTPVTPTPDGSPRCDGCDEPISYNARDFMFRRDYWEPWRMTKGHINCIDNMWQPQDFHGA